MLRLFCSLLLCSPLLVAPVCAQEALTLTEPDVETIAASWHVVGLYVDVNAPNIEVSLQSDVGRRFVWRFVVCEPTVDTTCSPETGTRTEVLNAIRFINRGDFRPLGKTLNQWILEQIIARKIKTGTVSP